VSFDDTVRVAGGNAAIANASRASVLAGRPRASGRVLTIPLRAGLPNGDYSVRWSIVSDDGHREQGVLAFAVGAGARSPTSVLGSGTPLGWGDLILRALYYLGILAGGGAAVFGLLARGLLGPRLTPVLSHLLFFALLAAFLGASGILHAAPPGTRFDLVMKVAVTIALVGGAAAALAPTFARLLPLAGVCSLALIAAPTLSGHALDRDQPRLISVPVDLAHAASASVWFGGLLSLVFVLPRAAADEARRTRVVRRFSSTALISVGLLAATGIVRALTELDSVTQIWSTSYGRTLIVKSALFAPLVALGWLNRTLLLGVFARLRRSASLEAGILVAVVVAVAVLTELRPGIAVARRAVAAAPASPAPAALPPRDAVVEAHELGSLAVAIARTPGHATVTLLGPDGTGASGRDVRIDGVTAAPCGSGCYRAAAAAGAVGVSVGGAATTFDVPVKAPAATQALRRITHAYVASRTIVFDETLASSPTDRIQTRFTVVAPNRLSYVIRGGPAAIVIGSRRWDRTSQHAPYVESAQTPIRVVAPLWSQVSNAHEIAPGVFTFLDRSIPAWFRVTVTGSLPRVVRMTAAAHFMTERYVGFDVSATVSPPAR
jgi:copper transport protein